MSDCAGAVVGICIGIDAEGEDASTSHQCGSFIQLTSHAVGDCRSKQHSEASAVGKGERRRSEVEMLIAIVVEAAELNQEELPDCADGVVQCLKEHHLLADLRLKFTPLDGAVLAGCSSLGMTKDKAPLSSQTVRVLAALDTTPAAPMLVRVFKESSEFEVWKRTPEASIASSRHTRSASGRATSVRRSRKATTSRPRASTTSRLA